MIFPDNGVRGTKSETVPIRMMSPVETWVAEQTALRGDLNPQTLRTWQCETLNAVIQYARGNSRFYRGKLNSIADMTELPFTFPADIARDPFAFLAVPQHEVARVTTLTTSGTTGTKKRLFFTAGDLERTQAFFAVGMSTMLCRGEHAMILISDDTENSLGSLLRSAIARLGASARILGKIRNASEAIHASKDADCLIGMPAELFYMSRTEPNLRPKSVLLTADYVPQCVIESIRATWRCRVFSHYGLTEVGFGFAVDCDYHTGYHTRDADFIIEILDPETCQPVHPGEQGEIVITSLHNEAMPLIRYRTGDISRIMNAPCGCDGILPRLDRIEGRCENTVPVGDGETLSIHRLDELLFAHRAVRGFDAFLTPEGEQHALHLTIDAYTCLDPASLAANLPPGLMIEVAYGNADPFAHRGKRRIHLCAARV